MKRLKIKIFSLISVVIITILAFTYFVTTTRLGTGSTILTGSSLVAFTAFCIAVLNQWWTDLRHEVEIVRFRSKTLQALLHELRENAQWMNDFRGATLSTLIDPDDTSLSHPFRPITPALDLVLDRIADFEEQQISMIITYGGSIINLKNAVIDSLTHPAETDNAYKFGYAYITESAELWACLNDNLNGSEGPEKPLDVLMAWHIKLGPKELPIVTDC